MSWIALGIGCAAVAAVASLIVWGIRYASRRGEERGELSGQAEILARNERRAARARRVANRPVTGNPAELARRMRERLARRMRDVAAARGDLPPDS